MNNLTIILSIIIIILILLILGNTNEHLTEYGETVSVTEPGITVSENQIINNNDIHQIKRIFTNNIIKKANNFTNDCPSPVNSTSKQKINIEIPLHVNITCAIQKIQINEFAQEFASAFFEYLSNKYNKLAMEKYDQEVDKLTTFNPDLKKKVDNKYKIINRYENFSKIMENVIVSSTNIYFKSNDFVKSILSLATEQNFFDEYSLGNILRRDKTIIDTSNIITKLINSVNIPPEITKLNKEQLLEKIIKETKDKLNKNEILKKNTK